MVRFFFKKCETVYLTKTFHWIQTVSPMLVAKDKKTYNIGENPTIILYTYYYIFNRHAGTPKQRRQNTHGGLGYITQLLCPTIYWVWDNSVQMFGIGFKYFLVDRSQSREEGSIYYQ